MKKILSWLLASVLFVGVLAGDFLFAEEGIKDSYIIRDQGKERKYQIDKSVIYGVTPSGKLGISKLKSMPQNMTSYARVLSDTAQASGKPAGVVLYLDGKERKAAFRRILLNRTLLLVKEGTNVEQLRTRLGAKKSAVIQSDGSTFVVLTFSDALEVLRKCDVCRADPQVIRANPMLSSNIRKMVTPTDPRFAYSAQNVNYQWHLWNTGQNNGVLGVDVNIRDVWDDYTGLGVTIAIADDGLEIGHPDLLGNANTFPHYNWSAAGNPAETAGDPTPPAGIDDSHGTSVGGVAGASWLNNEGGTGSAPNATLVGLRWLTYDFITPGDLEIGQVLGWGANFGTAFGATNVDVHNNSWGPGHPTFLSEWGDLEKAGMLSGINTGRGGLGTIYVFAAGNDAENNGNANYSDYTSSVNTVAVGAINDQGKKSYYSNPGCCLTISAPSNGSIARQGITTTALRSDYTDEFGGTSSATPLTSGVIALMLEANPNLGWRDVQEILIVTARKNDAFDGDWQTNAAGHHFNHKYGAGMVDAGAAVDAAKTWVNLAEKGEVSIAQLAIATVIPEGGKSVDLEFDFFERQNKRVEHVEVRLSIDHNSRSDCECVLVSPSGVESRLTETFNDPDDEADINFTFMSNFYWGEDSSGIWKVKFFDRRNNFELGNVLSAEIIIHGVDAPLEIPPVVLSSDNVGVVVNTPLNYVLEQRLADTVTMSSSLPLGLVYDDLTNTISGVPTVIGTSQVLFTLTNIYGETQFVLTIRVAEEPGSTLAAGIEQEEGGVASSGEGTWALELVDTFDGSDAVAVESGLYNGGFVDLTLQHASGGVVTFQWKVSSEEGADRLWFYPSTVSNQTWSGFISGDRSWGGYATRLADSQGTLTWRYKKDTFNSDFEDRAFLDNVKIYPESEYADMLKDHAGANIDFATTSRALWTPQLWLTSPDGKILRSSSIGNGQFSDLEASVVGPGRLKFSWMVSSEGADVFQFVMGGAIRSSISGSTQWAGQSFIVGAGQHSFKWRYLKDFSGSSNLDSAFLDSVFFIKHYTYETWAEEQFTPEQLADPAISGLGADPNENGISNLLEYAYGGAPLGLDHPEIQPTVVTGDSDTKVSYQVNTGLTDLTYTLESSSDLVNWNDVPATLTASEGEIDTYTFAYSPEPGDSQELFFRVRVVKLALP